MQLVSYLERLDQALKQPVILCIYGSAVCILLDEPDRTSLDVDVAGPYSQADLGDLRRAAEQAGLPLNPSPHYQGDHLEWISALRLCLPPPLAGREIILWQGAKLIIKTVAIPQLIASKLIRYDEIDRTDILYLCRQAGSTFPAIEKAAGELPMPFREDAMVLENLANLKADMQLWGLS